MAGGFGHWGHLSFTPLPSKFDSIHSYSYSVVYDANMLWDVKYFGTFWNSQIESQVQPALPDLVKPLSQVKPVGVR